MRMLIINLRKVLFEQEYLVCNLWKERFLKVLLSLLLWQLRISKVGKNSSNLGPSNNQHKME